MTHAGGLDLGVAGRSRSPRSSAGGSCGRRRRRPVPRCRRALYLALVAATFGPRSTWRPLERHVGAAPLARPGRGARRALASASRGAGAAPRARRGRAAGRRPRAVAAAGRAARRPRRTSATRPRARLPARATGRLVDAQGRPGRARRPTASATTLVRDGRVVAVLGHAPGLLDDEQLVEEVAPRPGSRSRTSGCRPRSRHGSRSCAPPARGSSTAGDAERRRLERDLHDGAQQRLVGLSLVAAARCARGSAGGRELAALDEADAELRLAIAELRELAHGIFPAVLADEGLAAAVEALAEEGRVPSRSARCPTGVRRRPSRRPRTPSSPRPRGRRAAAGTSAPTRVDGAAGRRGRERRRDGSTSSRCEDRVGALDGRLDGRRDATGGVTDPRGAPVRVVIADDEMLLREGLARLLAEAGFEVVGKAGTPTSCSRARRADPPGRRDRRHPDAADPHRRGPRRRAGDPRSHPEPSACSCSPTTSSRATRCACSSSTRALGLPAQGARLGRRGARRRAAPDRRGRVRDRPDDRRAARRAAARGGPLDELTDASARCSR